jgi:hypothetical protein
VIHQQPIDRYDNCTWLKTGKIAPKRFLKSFGDQNQHKMAKIMQLIQEKACNLW